MNPLTILVPLILVLSGLLMFFLLPLDLWVRVVILLGELLGAALVGFILWRRGQC